MLGSARQGTHLPITPERDGMPPGWSVECQTCPFKSDAHGRTKEEAEASVAAVHQAGHALWATAVDYARDWTIPARPLAGIPASTGAHALYRRLE